MKYPIYEYLTVKIDADMKKWLAEEANNQMANMSVITRQALKLLMEEKRKEKDYVDRIDKD